jgi:hypothetical protein
MPNREFKITGICEIAKGMVYLNGNKVHENDDQTLESTLSAVVPKFKVVHSRFGKMDRLAQLGYTCVEMIINNGNITQYNPDEVSIILSNNSSSLDTDYKYQNSTQTIPSPALFVYTLPNIVLAEICIKNKFKGENLFFISDKFDPSLLFEQASNLLENNKTGICICGWVEVFNDKYHGIAFIVENNNSSSGFSIDFNKENIANLIKIN